MESVPIKNNDDNTSKPYTSIKREIYNLTNEPLDNVVNAPSYENIGGSQDINELLKTGVINLNKPMGPTSHQVSSWVKLIFDVAKLGHGGTLDPRVTGVLPLAFEASTKLLHVLNYSTKEYVGVMRLHSDQLLKKIKCVSEEFVGPIYQTPPLRSAVKRQLRIRTIYSLDILEQQGRDVLFKVECEGGTYIRSLVHDIGLVLGSGAHMQELRRVRTGPFHERDSVTLHELKDAVVAYHDENEPEQLLKLIKPRETILLDLPRVIIQDSAVDAVCHGAPLALPGILQFDDLRRKGESAAIFTRKGEAVALGEVVMRTNEILSSTSGIALKTSRVLMPLGTYKKGWKTKN